MLKVTCGDWDSFTLGSLPGKRLSCESRSRESTTKAAPVSCKRGNLSKGVNLVTSMSHLSIAGSSDSFEKLPLRHPSAGPSSLTTA